MKQFDAGGLRIGLSPTGQVCRLYDLHQGKEYLAAGQTALLMTVVAGGQEVAPSELTYDEAGKRLKLVYGRTGITATIQVAIKPTHVTLELEDLVGPVPTRIHWGPFPTTIRETVGETVGVVRDDRFALGLQGLNVQTIGGAAPRDYGSVLYAYSIEHDGGVIGSKIALFGCPAPAALETLGKIEVAEGLPHPMLDGVWGKVSPTARLSYLIVPFGEGNLEEVLDLARQAGFRYVYHPGPFRTWGHFQLNPAEFPEGDESMRRCVERAAPLGIRLGVHTLSGFITTNDPYVTPVPDPRLARWGSSTLTGAIDAAATEIGIADPEPFRNRGTLSAALIGSEIVTYEAVSESEPWRLLGCSRGAFGTKASAHEAGADIGKLADHAYRTFYPGIENGMMDEMTDRLVELFNTTGLRQISFDGLEGLSTYGYGEYARNRFVKQCFDGWQQEVISDASNSLHVLWHIHTRMNWGEPWGKPTREGMPEYRFQNQAYFDRNFLPRMLGWFELRAASAELEATTLDDMEWMLAKAAGYDAGFAVASSVEAMRANGQTPALLACIRAWEEARHAGAFSEEQRRELRDPAREFHLEALGEGRWQLQPVAFSRPFTWPAEPSGGPEATWEIENRFSEQPLRFVLRVLPSPGGNAFVTAPSFSVNGRRVAFPVQLQPWQYLVCEGQMEATVYDANWNRLQTVAASGELPKLPPGQPAVHFACRMTGEARAEVKFKTVGEPEEVAVSR
jgi:hypothetical protein